MRIFYCVLILAAFCLSAFSQETFTLTTYYPAPFGVYNEVRSRRLAIGDNYFQQSVYPWHPETGSDGKQIGQNTDLVVEGNVGIGTYSPIVPLDVMRTIIVRGEPPAHSPPYTPTEVDNALYYIGFRDINNQQQGFIGDGTAADHNITVASRYNIDFYTYQNVTADGGGIPGSDKMTITNAGDVGIGTMDPPSRLSVNGHIWASDGGLNPGNDAFVLYKPDSANPASRFYFRKCNGPNLGSGSNPGTDLMVIDNAGNVGIGTTTPQTTLDVNGALVTRGNHLYVYNPETPAADNPNTAVTTQIAQGRWGIVVDNADGRFTIGQRLDGLPDSGGWIDPDRRAFVIFPNAKTGSIQIRTGGKVVMPYGWGTADYVFEPNYKLMPIDKLTDYVKKNKCLPGMSELKSEDTAVNDILMKQTEKIEELTLYVIQLNEKIKALEKKNGELTKK